MNHFFSYDPEDGFRLHKTMAEAKVHVQEGIDIRRDDASDGGWDEDTTQLCWGVVIGGAVETARMPWTEHQKNQGLEPSEHPEFDEYVDYGVGPWTAK